MMLALAVLSGGATLANVCQGLEGGPGDVDGDGVPAASDCDDSDPSISETPGGAQALQLSKLSPTVALLERSPDSTADWISTGRSPYSGVMFGIDVKHVPEQFGNRKRKELCESIGGIWHGKLLGKGECEPHVFIKLDPFGD